MNIVFEKDAPIPVPSSSEQHDLYTRPWSVWSHAAELYARCNEEGLVSFICYSEKQPDSPQDTCFLQSIVDSQRRILTLVVRITILAMQLRIAHTDIGSACSVPESLFADTAAEAIQMEMQLETLYYHGRATTEFGRAQGASFPVWVKWRPTLRLRFSKNVGSTRSAIQMSKLYLEEDWCRNWLTFQKSPTAVPTGCSIELQCSAA